MFGPQQLTNAAKKHARAVVDEVGVSFSVGRVGGVYADGQVNLQRQGNQRTDGTWPADGVPTKVLNKAHRLDAGDFVMVAHYGTTAMVLGRIGKTGDKDIEGLATGAHLNDDSVGGRALASHSTDDASRAVAATHQKTNSTDARVLQSHPTDNAQRAVVRDAIRTDAVDSRILSGTVSGDDALRSVRTEHIGDFAVRAHNQATNSTDARVLQSHATDDNFRPVFSTSIRTNSANSRVLLGHATDDTLRAVGTEHVQNAAITAAKLAKPSVGAIEIFDGNVINAKLATDSVTKSKVALQTIGISEMHDELRGGDITDWRLRRMGGTTTGVNQTAAMADHFHSVPFTWLPKADRLRINALAVRLEEHKASERPGPMADVLEILGDVLHILCDDPDLDRWERERKLDADPEWAKDYRLAHHMHRDGPVRPIPPDPADHPGPRALWSWDEEKHGAKVAGVMAFKRALAETERSVG